MRKAAQPCICGKQAHARGMCKACYAREIRRAPAIRERTRATNRNYMRRRAPSPIPHSTTIEIGQCTVTFNGKFLGKSTVGAITYYSFEGGAPPVTT